MRNQTHIERALCELHDVRDAEDRGILLKRENELCARNAEERDDLEDLDDPECKDGTTSYDLKLPAEEGQPGVIVASIFRLAETVLDGLVEEEEDRERANVCGDDK